MHGRSVPRLGAAGIVIGGTLLACAPPAPAPPAGNDARSTPAAGATPRDKDTFLWLRSIDGFNAIDDEHIVLHSGTKHALVKTFGRCDDLRYSETVAVEAPLGYLDGSGLGHIVYDRGFGGKTRCPIDRIVAVKDLKEAKALVERGKAEKARRTEAAPSPSPPAR